MSVNETEKNWTVEMKDSQEGVAGVEDTGAEDLAQLQGQIYTEIRKEWRQKTFEWQNYIDFGL